MVREFIRLKDGVTVRIDDTYLTDSIKKTLGEPKPIEIPQAIKDKNESKKRNHK